jgi:predicted permease
MSRLRSLWRNLVHHNRVERDLDDEVRAMFALLVEEKVGAGMSEAQARRAATIELGRVESIKEQVREVRAGARWDTFRLDLRHSVRLLARSPAFTAFAVASLALGIGATGAIFTLFDNIVLRKLPVEEPDRLVVASFGRPGRNHNYSLPYPQFEAIRTRSQTLSGALATNPFGRVNVGIRGEPGTAEGIYVSGGYYATLGVSPARGRLFEETDDRPGQAVAVLSYGYWQRRFGGREDILGSAITLNELPFTIVGVEPASFHGTEVGRPYDLAVPLRARDALDEGSPLWDQAFATWIYVMGRLRPGATIEQAEQELNVIFRQVHSDGARTPNEVRLAREMTLRLQPGSRGAASDLRNQYERWLGMMLGLLAAVLLLASLNIATLLLSRADVRQREIATRLALGAGRWRLVRQFLTESLVLATLAGALGLAISVWGSRTLLRMAVPSAPQLPLELAFDLRMMLFTAAVSLGTCLLFGLIPAIRATSPRALVSARQVGGSRQRRRLDRVLVGAQVALSLVLLVVAGLFLRTLGTVWAQDPGYDRRNVLMFSVDARLAGKRGPALPATYRRLLDELRTAPGARAVSMSAVRPVSDSYYFVSVVSKLGDKALPNDQGVRVAFNVVAPGYFGVLGIPLAGRDFADRDSLDAPRVAIISARLARHFAGNPIGQQLEMGRDGTYEVVGVAGDSRYARVKDSPREVVYLPIFQTQPRHIFYAPTFEIRYTGSASDLMASIQAAVSRTEPALAPFRVRTLEEQTQDSLSRERLIAFLTSYFGAFAGLLACIGLYGLMSYRVTQRTPEMGLRLALGAQPSAVRWLVVRDATATVLVGAAAGLVCSFLAARMVQSQLFGVKTHDPIALAGATVLLLMMAVAAAYLPARRASRTDPLTALRHE